VTKPDYLQHQYGPNGICFGCGPKNPIGLRIESYVDGDQVIAKWMPKPGYEGFPGMMNGGIISALLDCHSNWAAAHYLMKRKGLTEPECTVTGKFNIQFFKPTPMDKPVTLKAKLKDISDK